LLYLAGVGDKEFAMEIKAKLNAKAMSRSALENNEDHELLENPKVFTTHSSTSKKCSLRLENDHFLLISL
jgi:hypothetical protein